MLGAKELQRAKLAKSKMARPALLRRSSRTLSERQQGPKSAIAASKAAQPHSRKRCLALIISYWTDGLMEPRACLNLQNHE